MAHEIKSFRLFNRNKIFAAFLYQLGPENYRIITLSGNRSRNLEQKMYNYSATHIMAKFSNMECSKVLHENYQKFIEGYHQVPKIIKPDLKQLMYEALKQE